MTPNRLKQCFEVSKANVAWVSDITYVKVGNAWYYLCSILDLFNPEVAGWSFADHMWTSLVVDALNSALYKRKPGVGLLFHSDRGSQYASDEFQRLLKENKMFS